MDTRVVAVDVVIPVRDERDCLAASVERLHHYLSTSLPFTWQITIADNGSTDDTLAIAETLAANLPNIRVLTMRTPGRGRALRAAWTSSDAAVVAYMDVDLSTGLGGFLPLVAPLISGQADLAVGSRLVAGATVDRGPRREVISRVYNLLLRVVFSTRIRDAQCGFKAIRSDVAAQLLPLVENEAWFFDTELILLAERNGLRIQEVPVDWVDDPDSRVNVWRTAIEDLSGVRRMAWAFLSGRGAIDLTDGVPGAP